MRRLALKRSEPRSTRRRILGSVFGVVMGLAAAFAFVDQWFGFRERAAAMAGYDAVHQSDERAIDAIRSRIAGLLRPRDGAGGIGGDQTARLIDAALLYGRLALIEEHRGNGQAAATYMARSVSLLKSAGHPEPTEAHIRKTMLQQDARVRRNAE
jgi:hypothetical protein